MIKPYSESCDENKQSILSVLQPLLSSATNVLEIGSGTGQHAIHFAQMMPHLTWHTSDCAEYLEGINCWVKQSKLTNVKLPFELNVTHSRWPTMAVENVFTSNTLHIMHQPDVVNLFNGVAELLTSGGNFIIYGPFNYKKQYTSDSNKKFDGWLKSRDPDSGIKHFEEIVKLAVTAGMVLRNDFAMPANNRILHFQGTSIN